MSWSVEVESSLRQIWDSAQSGSWASFDFDNTIVSGDISEGLLGYQITHGLIPEANLTSFPPLTVDGSQVSASEDPAAYYGAIMRSGGSDGVDYANYPGAVWLAQVLAGLSLEDVLNSLVDICGETTTTFLPTTPTTNAGFVTPVLRDPVVELIGNLITHGVRVRVISAGLVWAVRWYVCSVLNPQLAAGFGPDVQIELSDVMGIGVALLDSRTGTITSDRYLLSDAEYLACSANRTSELRLTPLIDGPLTFAEGKIAGATERYGTRPPHLVVGDSPGDLSMWNYAEHRLWLRKPGSAANATLEASLKAPYVVQNIS